MYGANTAENLVCGFNMHYLPYPLIRAMIRAFTNDPSGAVRAGLKHVTVKRVYRSYKIKGVNNPRKIDWRAFMAKVSVMRQLTPGERQALIMSVEMQLANNPRDLQSINRLVADIVQRKTAQMQGPLPSTSSAGQNGAKIVQGPRSVDQLNKSSSDGSANT